MHIEKLSKVSVIILNYNGKKTLKKCLDSVYESEYVNKEVYLVDNNSQDDSLEVLKNYPEVYLDKLSENRGFSAGNNVAIRKALQKKTDYILLLNNDAILEKNTITLLVEASKKENDVALLSPRIFTRKNIPWFCGGKIQWVRMRAVHTSCSENKDEVYETEYITGCSLFAPRDIWEKVGLLDESYFLYYEDVDFSLRAQKKGFSLKVVSKATVRHSEESQFYTKKLYHLVSSGVRFFTQNTPKSLYPWMLMYFCLRKCKNRIDLYVGKNIVKARLIHKALDDVKKTRS